MKITRRQLRQIIKEALEVFSNQSDPEALYDRLLYLRSEHGGELALLDSLGEEKYREVTQIRDEMRADSNLEGYDAYRAFFDRVKEEFGLFPRTVRNLWDERHETPSIDDLKVLKSEYEELSGQFESGRADTEVDSMYGRKRNQVVHVPTGKIVNTSVDRKGSLGT